jgi:hypothetical protein
MPISRAERRRDRRPRVVRAFGETLANAVLDVFELAEYAWHDCYGASEITLSEDLIDDILLCSGGDLAKLVSLSLMTVCDFRDLKVLALETRMRRREIIALIHARYSD